MDNTYFRSYEGREPYLFVSYAHLDSARVVPLLSRLKYAPGKLAETTETGEASNLSPPVSDKKRNAGGCYRIWYDEGIDAGSEWPENIERHLQGAAQTVVFWSKASAGSKNCYREMVNANASGKPVLFVLLDDTPLPQAQVGKNSKVLSAWDVTTETLLRSILSGDYLHASLIGPDYPAKPQPPWVLIACLLAFLCAVVGGAVYLTRRQPPDVQPVAAVNTPAVTAAPTKTALVEKTQAVFTNPNIENYVYESLQRFDLMPLTIHNTVLRDAVYARLQLPADAEMPDVQALSTIEELYICGDTFADKREDIRMVNGQYFVSGEKVRQGNLQFSSLRKDVSDFAVIACMTGLHSLALCYQDPQIADGMESLATLSELTYLDLSGNAAASNGFGYLWENRKLTELNLAHTGVSMFYALNSVENLESVYISRDMITGTAQALDSRLSFDVIVID